MSSAYNIGKDERSLEDDQDIKEYLPGKSDRKKSGLSLVTDNSIMKYFGKTDFDIRTLSPLTLAFLGDDVYDTVIRTLIVSEGDMPPAILQKKASSIVRAGAQSRILSLIEDELTDAERDIVRRGRNAKSKTVAKNADIHDYRAATGLEALVGYLFLTGQDERILELIKDGLEKYRSYGGISND